MMPLGFTHRRGFLGRVAASAVAAVLSPRWLAAAEPGQQANPDAWLDRMTGTHRQLFDMPTDAGGLPMVHILNYLNTYNQAYGAKDSEIAAVGTFYGATTLYGLNDAMWAKYRLGEFLNAKDAAGATATKNPWRSEVSALGMTLPVASIEALQKRGVTFLLCNNALNFFIGEVAKARNLDRAAVDTDFRANFLPGVVLVPAMVIAIEKAQGRGFAYNKQ